jgi:hypothetical protein
MKLVLSDSEGTDGVIGCGLLSSNAKLNTLVKKKK